MEAILRIAQENQKKALEVIEKTDVINIWESVGARINLVGSLKTGLLVKHRDVDFHIYTPTLDIPTSFKAMSRLAENPAITQILYGNLIDTDEKCIEWHATYKHTDGEVWQIDMIHILGGSKYDGYFERVADRIIEVVTPEQRDAIIRLKYETPETVKIGGVEYYKAVITDGIRNYAEFEAWRKTQTLQDFMNWMP